MSARKGLTLAMAIGAVGVVVLALQASCRSAPPVGGVGVVLPSVEVQVPPPVLRVGVVVEASRVSIAADSGVRLWRPGNSAAPVTDRWFARVTFAPIPPATAPGPRFQIQAGSFRDEQGARAMAQKASRAAGRPAATRWNEDARAYQLRVGDWPTRKEAEGVLARLGQAGLAGAYVVEEPTPGRCRLLESGEEFARVMVVPAHAGEDLSVDGLTYRGLVEVLAIGGGVTAVNLVNAEDYLRGVVPNELSPQAFPQLEALKAQAIAARSYAFRNRGQYRAHGFDICATQACQVYRGKSTEQPLTDQAVAATRGLVAKYGDAIINALYTSTCGGHTEDGVNIFEGEPAPYLKGVSCAPERATWRRVRTAWTAGMATSNGLGHLARDCSLLALLGVTEPHQNAAQWLKGNPSDAEVEVWVRRLLAALKRPQKAAAAGAPLARRATFWLHLVEHLGWIERARQLLTGDDLDYLLQATDADELRDDDERRAAALLLHDQLLAPGSDQTLRPDALITRAEAASLLAGVLGNSPGAILTSADFKDLSGQTVTLQAGSRGETLALAEDVRLFRIFDDLTMPVSELFVMPGEQVRYLAQGRRVVWLEVQQTRLGASADRSSRFYRWDVTLTPDEVAQGIERYGHVGRVRDLVPRRTGVSGRVVELTVVGSQSSLVLKGLQIRWGLGLRENLFTIEREVNEEGAVERFLITGKGWGHGVGLCQVGAYGLARGGASCEAILKHYYTGISIEPLSPDLSHP